MSTKVCLVKAMIFPVVMYGCESWTIKKAEHWTTDAFELLCWIRLLRVPWTLRRSNQSILKEMCSVLSVHWKDWCWSWISNTLATWCKELTHLKRPWCWERLKAGAEGHNRGWDGWMPSLTQWTWVWVNSGSWWRTRRPGVLRSMGSQRVGHVLATELNWFYYMDFPDGSDAKESACNVGDPGSSSGLGRSPGEGNDNSLQYSCLENSMDRPYSLWGHKELDTLND